MADVVNWYEKIPNENKKKKLPKNFKNHCIHHNSMILCVGQTGSGKTNSLIDYISRSSGEFHKIIIVSFSTLDEPLYKFLANKCPDVEFINSIDELPPLSDFDDDQKDKPKLLVFDDFLALSKKEMKKIHPYLISGRKYGFTIFLLSQEYVAIDKIITRNIHYFILYKINDSRSIDNIIRNHNPYCINKDIMRKAYQLCIEKPLGFMVIDLKSREPKHRYREGFLNFLKLDENQGN